MLCFQMVERIQTTLHAECCALLLLSDDGTEIVATYDNGNEAVIPVPTPAAHSSSSASRLQSEPDSPSYLDRVGIGAGIGIGIGVGVGFDGDGLTRPPSGSAETLYCPAGGLRLIHVRGATDEFCKPGQRRRCYRHQQQTALATTAQ